MNALRLPVALVLAAALLLPVVSAQEATPESLTLWAHGEAREGAAPAVTLEDTLWMNTDAGDARATDTANGPGYCPTTPVTTLYLPQVGDPLCFAENLAKDQTGQSSSFDHTWSLALDPALDTSHALQVGDSAVFQVAFGANSGSCAGEFTAKLATGDTVVAETAATPFEFASGYVMFAAEAPVQAEAIPSEGALTWTIHAVCEGTGLFLGIHAETGKSSITLPLWAPPPETEEEAESEPETNATAEDDTEENATAKPEPTPTETEAPEPVVTTEPEPEIPAETADTQSVEDESSGIPSPGIVALLASLGTALWVARRRL